MKKLCTLLMAVILTPSAFAQVPEKMSYQAVVRDAGNALVTSQAVGIQLSILQGSVSGTAVYVETQTPTTNIFGLVTIEIGSGTVVYGTFNTIDWINGPYFIKTETDPTGGTNYTITGTSQLMSVPYALYAKTSGNGAGPVGADGISAYQTWLNLGNTGTETDFIASLSSTSESATNASAVAAETIRATVAEEANATNISTNETNISNNDTAIALNTAKVGLTTDQATSLDNISGVNTGDQDISGIETNTTAIALNTAKVGLTTEQKTILSNTSGVNTGDQDITAMTHSNRTALDAVSGTNSGDQDLSSYLKSENDPVFGASVASGITNSNVTTWNNKSDFDSQWSSLTGAPDISNGTTIGQILYWDGSTWSKIEPGADGQILRMSDGIPIWDHEQVDPGTYSIGDNAFGGTVVYILQLGDPRYDEHAEHGIILGPQIALFDIDLGLGAPWYNESNTSTGATGLLIGDGSTNTAAIVAVQGEGYYAAKLCSDLSRNGYSDWYLPSRDELMKLYLYQRDYSSFSGDLFWSSSEIGNNTAYAQRLGGPPIMATSDKYVRMLVFAIRSF